MQNFDLYLSSLRGLDELQSREGPVVMLWTAPLPARVALKSAGPGVK
jgi:hypothetical protein